MAPLTVVVRSLAVRLPIAVALLSVPSAAFAQAWVPPGGIGALNVSFQSIANTGHLLTDGELLKGFDSTSRSLLLEFDYAVTDRFSFTVGLPYVAARYQGPEPPLFPLAVDECHCWNHGWQDLNATARYNVLSGVVALTPSVAIGAPTHNYESFGEAVLGRNLNEFRIAVDAGATLDRISPRLAVSGRYSFAFVERVIDLQNNRSNFSTEIAFLASRKLSTRVAFAWQRSHGGLRGTEFQTEEQGVQFDRIIRDNSFHMGAGVSYSLPAVDLFAGYLHFVGGTDTHAGRVITFGVSWPFQLR